LFEFKYIISYVEKVFPQLSQIFLNCNYLNDFYEITHPHFHNAINFVFPLYYHLEKGQTIISYYLLFF